MLKCRIALTGALHDSLSPIDAATVRRCKKAGRRPSDCRHGTGPKADQSGGAVGNLVVDHRRKMVFPEMKGPVG